MDHAPQIGARVVYRGSFGSCLGTVTKIHKTPLYNDDGFDWEHDEGMPPQIGLTCEREWRVTVKVDTLPARWPYGVKDKFCPEVSELELLELP